MQLTKNKVDYTELVITMSADEVRRLIADHVRSEKNVEITPSDVAFDIDDTGVMDGDAAELLGVTAVVLKRGRSQKNFKKAKRPEVVDRPAEMSIAGTPEPAETNDSFDNSPKDPKKPKAAKKKAKPAKKESESSVYGL